MRIVDRPYQFCGCLATASVSCFSALAAGAVLRCDPLHSSVSNGALPSDNSGTASLLFPDSEGSCYRPNTAFRLRHSSGTIPPFDEKRRPQLTTPLAVHGTHCAMTPSANRECSTQFPPHRCLIPRLRTAKRRQDCVLVVSIQSTGRTKHAMTTSHFIERNFAQSWSQNTPN